MSKCGVPKSALADRGVPERVEPEYLEKLPEFLTDIITTDILMTANDDLHISEEAQEAAITKGFKDVGIKVRFKG